MIQDHVCWVDRFPDKEVQSELRITAGEMGGRVILYAGEQQGDEIVSNGPLIGDSQEDICWLYLDFRQGKLNRIAAILKKHRIVY